MAQIPAADREPIHFDDLSYFVYCSCVRLQLMANQLRGAATPALLPALCVPAAIPQTPPD